MITARQLTALSLFSLLPQAGGLFAALTAERAGVAGWLAPLPAVLPALGALFLLQALYRRHPDAPLDRIVLSALGPVAGRAFLGLAALWCLLRGALVLRLHGARGVELLFPRTHPAGLMLLLLLVTLRAARGRLSVLSRAGVLCLLLVSVGLLLLWLPALPSARLMPFLPAEPADATRLLQGAWPLAALFGFAVLTNFLSGQVDDRTNTGRRSVPPLLLCAGATALLLLFSYQVFGAALAARMPEPFPAAAGSLSGPGGTARLAPFVLSLWSLCDFLHLALTSLTAMSLLGAVTGRTNLRPLAIPLHVLLFLGALVIPLGSTDLRALATVLLPWGDGLLAFGLPPLLYLADRLRRKL
jgi:hypothetical protein